jgi:hypothetical protein
MDKEQQFLDNGKLETLDIASGVGINLFNQSF